jgi:methyl-galactoside transport system substrate-binding protein
MRIRKAVALGVLVGSLSLASCGQVTKKIGIFVYDGADTFMASFVESIKDHLTMDSLPFNSFDAKRSQTTQNKQIISALEGGNERLLIVNLVDRLAASAIVEKSEAASLPTIFINREPLSSDLEGHKEVFYVGSNASQAGKLQATLAEQLYDKTALSAKTSPYDKNKDGVIQIAVIKGEEGHQDTEYRTKWCTEKLTDDGYSINILTTMTGDWTRSGGYAAMKEIASSYYDGKDANKENVELVYCNNDDMASGAVQYLREEGIFSSGTTYDKQPIQVIGFDGTDVGLSLVQNGYIYGTVLNDAVSQANVVYELAKKIIAKTDLSNEKQLNYVDGKIIAKALL